jgi:hypothetical protein
MFSRSVRCTAAKIAPRQWYVTFVRFDLHRPILSLSFCDGSLFAVFFVEVQELGEAAAEVKSGSRHRTGGVSPVID